MDSQGPLLLLPFLGRAQTEKPLLVLKERLLSDKPAISLLDAADDELLKVRRDLLPEAKTAIRSQLHFQSILYTA
jgi:hypothetical protein